MHAQSIVATVAIQVILMAQAEAFRYAGEAPGVETSGDSLYPGGFFDPLGLGDDSETLSGEFGVGGLLLLLAYLLPAGWLRSSLPADLPPPTPPTRLQSSR